MTSAASSSNVGAEGEAKGGIATSWTARLEAARAETENRHLGDAFGVPVRGTIELVPTVATSDVALGWKVTRMRAAAKALETVSVCSVPTSTAGNPMIAVRRRSVDFTDAVVPPDARLGVRVIVNAGMGVVHGSLQEGFTHFVRRVRGAIERLAAREGVPRRRLVCDGRARSHRLFKLRRRAVLVTAGAPGASAIGHLTTALQLASGN